MVLIVCDTDFLIKISNDPLPRVDLKKLLKTNQFLVLPAVLREIEGLEKSAKSITARRARLARQLITESKGQFTLASCGQMREGNSSHEADQELIEFVREDPKERTLATLDGSLLSRIEKSGLPYMTLSNGKLLFRSVKEQHI